MVPTQALERGEIVPISSQLGPPVWESLGKVLARRIETMIRVLLDGGMLTWS